MNDLKYKFPNGGQLFIKEVSNSEIEAVITLLKAISHLPSITILNKPLVGNTSNKTVHVTPSDDKKTRPRIPEKINSERTLTTQLGDLVGEKYISSEKFPESEQEDEPEFYKTGIKIKDDIATFKTRLFCQECGARRNAYIPLGQETLRCYHCGTEHLVRKATPFVEQHKEYGEVPGRDYYGNFYIADERVDVWDRYEGESQ